MKQKPAVLLALSGGVDSSVAVLLLKQQGYRVTALFMKNFSKKNQSLKKALCWTEEENWARRISAILDIPLIILDTEKQYRKQVINKMINEYKSGLTPNPDTLCNKIIKFPLLWEEAKKRNIPLIATGHYARIKKTSKGFQLLAGKDKTKDQSYFLYQLTQSDLSHTLLPLGSMTKEEVRKIAEKNHFPNYNKPGTKGVCFIGNINMKSFLEKRISRKEGKVLTPEGKAIGTHQGTAYYTIGQRIGSHIGIEIKKPRGKEQQKWYIAEKQGNTVIAAPENHPLLKKQTIKIKNFHQINQNEKIPKNIKARIRHLGKFLPGKLSKHNNTRIFKLNKPSEAIAEGQAIVFYKKDILLAGGEIKL
jgi:tRNA-specific 2-thiouridylase